MATILDVFTELSFDDQDFEFMKKMVLTGEPGWKSLWQRLHDTRYEDYMPRYVSRVFNYVLAGGPSDLSMLCLHLIYFLMLAKEPFCQRIVVQELRKAGDHERADFFCKVYVCELNLYFEILFVNPYMTESVVSIARKIVALLKSSWKMQSAYNYMVTRNAQCELMKHDKELIDKARAERNSKRAMQNLTNFARKNASQAKSEKKSDKLSKNERYLMKKLKYTDEHVEEAKKIRRKKKDNSR